MNSREAGRPLLEGQEADWSKRWEGRGHWGLGIHCPSLSLAEPLLQALQD